MITSATAVYGTLHFDRAVGALFRGLGPPARSQHCLAHRAYTEVSSTRDLYPERLCTEDWKAPGALQGLQEFSGVRGPQLMLIHTHTHTVFIVARS